MEIDTAHTALSKLQLIYIENESVRETREKIVASCKLELIARIESESESESESENRITQRLITMAEADVEMALIDLDEIITANRCIEQEKERLTIRIAKYQFTLWKSKNGN
jgi:hypothetical protein